MREALESKKDSEETRQTIRACDALLRQIESIGEGDDADDRTQDNQHERH